ncbi:hypothetical protein cgR_2410 [Corynebacterium glutamicum R]|uniref:Uncharacterized protein n=1 Tax=Corynebacterium glutamicum (strain R) TaxID=340322 RepID=A0AB72VDI5_CORGB|nr:hypothetical protein cgR_2410 [Corynebacterium glutamicum R]
MITDWLINGQSDHFNLHKKDSHAKHRTQPQHEASTSNCCFRRHRNRYRHHGTSIRANRLRRPFLRRCRHRRRSCRSRNHRRRTSRHRSAPSKRHLHLRIRTTLGNLPQRHRHRKLNRHPNLRRHGRHCHQLRHSIRLRTVDPHPARRRIHLHLRTHGIPLRLRRRARRSRPGNRRDGQPRILHRLPPPLRDPPRRRHPSRPTGMARKPRHLCLSASRSWDTGEIKRNCRSS